ncbi:MAG: FixH family protein [Campylobacterales bacterium]|nr:FixH family protein [Campylobacterales bacterium]
MNKTNINAGKKWPWIIGLAIVGVIGFAIATVRVAIKNPVEMSEYGMQSYQAYEDNVNDIINAKLSFDKNYTIAFLTPQIIQKGAVIVYKITDKSNIAINDAKVDVVLTRPDTTKLDLNLTAPTISNGVYTFNSIDLPKEGRWDIMAKISIGDKQRYYNLKADTRYPNIFEF